MNTIFIPSTNSTPSVYFNRAEGKLNITGRSIPENSIEFYKELLNAVDDYIEKPSAITEVTIQLEYYNSSSAVCILNIFRKLKQLSKNGNTVVVKWLYEKEDEDTYNAGISFRGVLEMPIELIEIN